MRIRRSVTISVIRAALCFCVFLFAGVSAHGTSFSFMTEEMNFVRTAKNCATMYANDHEGRLPTSWADLDRYLAAPLDKEFKSSRPSVRYAILAPPLKLPNGEEIFLITRRPFRESDSSTNWYGGRSIGLREPGRYVAIRGGGENNFYLSYRSEPEIQEMFRGRESMLPAPDNDPEREKYERKILNQILFRRVMIAGFLILPVAGFYYLRKRTRVAKNQNQYGAEFPPN